MWCSRCGCAAAGAPVFVNRLLERGGVRGGWVERTAMSALPAPRGRVTDVLFDALRRTPHELTAMPDAVDDEDLQLALYCCYELHYRGFDGVDDRWEWEPSLLRWRSALERRFESDLHERV